MPTTTPLTDAINALTTYANETTGASDTTLSDAVATLVAGYGQGGGSSGWQRPAEWPDISKLDRTGEVAYLLYSADEETGFCDILVQANYKVTIGHIENDAFVADTAETTVASNSRYRKYFGSSSGGYKVVRIVGNAQSILMLSTSGTYRNLVDGHPCYTQSQGLLEVYGNLPNLRLTMDFSNMRYLQSVDILSAHPNAMKFTGCLVLQNIANDTWNLSTVTTFANAFQNCFMLKYVNTTNLVKSSCTNISNIFQNCTALESIDTSGWNTSNVTTFSGSFQGCKNLMELTFPSNFVTSNATSISSIIADCTLLDNIDMSDWDTSNVTTFSSVFSSCRSLKNLVFPSNFVTSKATNLSNMFNNCTSLGNVDMSDWDTSNVTNMQSLLNGVTMTKGDLSMLDMTKVTQANTANILANTINMPSITMPSTLTKLYSSAFTNAEAYEFHFLSTTPPTLNDASFPTMTYYSGRKIYVPYSADHSVLNAYKTATYWSSLASYIFEEPQG